MAQLRKIDIAMQKIANEIGNFIEKIMEETCAIEFAYRIDCDGTLFKVYMYCMKNRQTSGKVYTYKQIADLCIKRGIEMEFNTVVRQLILKAGNAPENNKILKNSQGSIQIDFNDVLWV